MEGDTVSKGKLKILLLFVSFLILSLLLYFSDVWKVVSIISSANPYYLLLAFSLSLLLMFVRTFRWNVLLRKLDIKIHFLKLFPVYMSGMFASNLTPGKIGEPVKSYLLKKTEGISISRTLPSVVMERVFDVFSVIIISLVGLGIVKLPANVTPVLFAIVLFYLTAIVLMFYISAKKGRIYYVSEKLFRFFRWLPMVGRLERFLEGFAEKFNRSIVKYKDAGISVKNFILSLFVWGAEGVILYLSFLSVGIPVNPLLAASFISISVLVGVISFLPGGLGSSEAVMVLLFTYVYSLPIHSATAAVLIYRFLGFWLNVFVGFACLNLLKFKIKSA